MTTQFDDYAVVVTGAGTGIGYGICEAFAQAGATVALNDVDAQLAQKSAQMINNMVGKACVTAYPCDVSDVDAVGAMIGDFAGQQGRLDVVVANAGITHFGDFLSYDPATFDQVMSVNMRGTFFTAQAAANLMIQHKTTHGRILLTSSVTGVQGYPNLSAYGMTKAAIIHLAKVLGVELGRHGLTVNAIAPGATATERTLDDPNYEAHWRVVNPNGHVGQVADIVNAVIFLAQPESYHINGQTIIVDGGWTNYSRPPEDLPSLDK